MLSNLRIQSVGKSGPGTRTSETGAEAANTKAETDKPVRVIPQACSSCPCGERA